MIITVTCPKCREAHIAIRYTPGTPAVYNLPNGDPGDPGDPDEIELEAPCLCWPDSTWDEDEVMLYSLVGAWLAWAEVEEEKAWAAMADDDDGL